MDYAPLLERRLAEVPSERLWTTREDHRITDLKKIIKLAKQRVDLNWRSFPRLPRHALGMPATPQPGWWNW